MIKQVVNICVMFLFLGSNAALAATVIEVQSKSNLLTILTDGKLARMNMPGEDYVIVDYKNHIVKHVSPQKQQVMLLEIDATATSKSGADIHTSMKDLGPGIKVAGYATQKYAYSANGKACGLIYASKSVYQKEGIKEMFLAMQTMIENQLAVLGGLAGMMDVCTLAEMNISNQVKNIGVPMRTEKNGRTETEIKSIKFGVTIAENTFVIPLTYRVITAQEKIGSAAKGLMKMQGKSPDQKKQIQLMMQQMQQMQQSRQMTPEMVRQMRQAQDMMKQNESTGQ